MVDASGDESASLLWGFVIHTPLKLISRSHVVKDVEERCKLFEIAGA